MSNKTKTILKWTIFVAALIGFSVGVYFILKALGVTDIAGLQSIINRAGAWGWLVFIVLNVLVTTLLCFVPATSMTFISLSVILFGPYLAIPISIIAVFLSSSLMFLIGNYGGEALAIKMAGEKNLRKAQELIDIKSKTLLPMMFMFPIFPDDALCLVAGMTKMKYWYFAIIVLIFRSIGIVTICLGINFIDWASLTSVDYFLLINVIAIDLIAIFKYQHKIEKWIIRRKKDDR